MPAQLSEHQVVAIPFGTSTVVLGFDPAKMELHGRPAGQDGTEVEVDIALYDFLMQLALKGPKVEQERNGVLWKFKRM